MLLYIIQANTALAIFALTYKYLLSHDTQFNIRRIFMLATVAIAFIFQFMPAIADIDFYKSEPTITHTILSTSLVQTTASSAAFDLSAANIIIAISILGSTLLFLRFIFGLAAIIKIKNGGKLSTINNHTIVIIDKELAPFSFCKWIFISPAQLNNSDLQNLIIHESSHIKGMHTIDVVISELLVIIFWFNPAVWFIRYAIRENLEFIADRDVINSGNDRKEYQYHLLKLSSQSSTSNVVNYFNVSQLKNRIIMMNREKTPRKAVVKYLLLLPILMLLSLTNNAQTQQKDSSKIKVNLTYSELKPQIIDDNIEVSFDTLEKLNPDSIDSMTGIKDSTSITIYGRKDENGTIIIPTKNKNNDTKVESSNSSNDDSSTTITISSKPYYIVDGKESTEKKVSKIDPETIESVNVLKGNSAIKQYGDKGKDGVIEIKIKK